MRRGTTGGRHGHAQIPRSGAEPDVAHGDPRTAIDAKIRTLCDWRGHALSRALIHAAVPGVVEQAKWRMPGNPDGVPM